MEMEGVPNNDDTEVSRTACHWKDCGDNSEPMLPQLSTQRGGRQRAVYLGGTRSRRGLRPVCDGENKIWVELRSLGAGQSAGEGWEGVTPRVKAKPSPLLSLS